MNTLTVATIFFFISFLFSMLGMGGSQLYIPILFWMGMDFKTQAIPLGILLNIVNTLSATFTYSRKKLIDWKTAIPFGITMILFAPLGTFLNVSLPTKPIILIFAIFTAAAAILMLSGWKPKKKILSTGQRKMLGLIGGAVLGFFAGLIGRGGGSFVVPLLYIAGLEPKVAAATSAFVVTCSGFSSFISHLLTIANPNWKLWTVCIIAVLSGSQLGSFLMATKLKSQHIKTIFGTILLTIAIILIYQAYFKP